MECANKTLCRLCLSQCDYNCCIDLGSNRQLYEVLQVLFPGMNLHLVTTPKICLPCVKKLKCAYVFKANVLENEVKINSDPGVDKSTINFCRLCLQKQTTTDGIIMLYENTTYSYQLIRTMIEIAITQLDFDIFQKPIVCALCWSMVKDIYSFKKYCFKAEEKLRRFSFVIYNSITVLSNQDVLTMIERENTLGEITLKDQSDANAVKDEEHTVTNSSNISVKSENSIIKDGEFTHRSSEFTVIKSSHATVKEENFKDDSSSQVLTPSTIKTEIEVESVEPKITADGYSEESNSQIIPRITANNNLHSNDWDSCTLKREKSVIEVTTNTIIISDDSDSDVIWLDDSQEDSKKETLFQDCKYDSEDSDDVFEENVPNSLILEKHKNDDNSCINILNQAKSNDVKQEAIAVSNCNHSKEILEKKSCKRKIIEDKTDERRKNASNLDDCNVGQKLPVAAVEINLKYTLKNQTYYCASCSFNTRRRASMLCHYRSSHVDPTTFELFECRFCLYVARRKDAVDAHEQNMHETSASPVSSSKSDKSSTKHYKPKMESYTCYMCRFTTKNKQILIRHIKTNHNKNI